MPGDHKESDEEKVTSEQCVVTQYMIDITENQLNSLRTICRTEDETTQQEICESEVGTLCLLDLLEPYT